LDANNKRLNIFGAVQMDSTGSANVVLSREVKDGDVLRAIQIVDGQESPPSSPREAAFFTGQLPRPIIDSTVHECTKRLRVKGVIAGAELRVTNMSTAKDDVEWPSDPDSIYYANQHTLTPQGTGGHLLRARQTMCPGRDLEDPRRISGPTSQEAVVIPKPNPVPPVGSVEHTAGADYFSVGGAIVGAFQNIHDNGVETGWAVYPKWSGYQTRWDVDEQTNISITQEMCGESSDPVEATLYPETHLEELMKAPEVMEPICPGASVIEARASMPGGKLGVLDANFNYIGAQATPDGTAFTRLVLPQMVSLSAGDVIHVRHVLRTGLSRDSAATVISQGLQLDVLGAKDIAGMPTVDAGEGAAGPSFRLAVCCEASLTASSVNVRVIRDDGLDYGTISLERERSGLYEGRWDWLVPNVAAPDGIWPPRDNHTYRVELAQDIPCGQLAPVFFDVVVGEPVRTTTQSSTILTQVVELEGGVPVALRANRRSGSGDPMLRVFRHNNNAARGVYSEEELTRDDDSGGGVNAFISAFTPPETASYLIVVHDTGEAGSGGKVDVLVDGQVLINNKPFGGTVMEVGRASAGDMTETLFEPNGALRHQLLVVDGSIQGKAAYFGQHESAPGYKSVRYEYPNQMASTQFVVFGSLDLARRSMGAVFNRLAHNDPDGDGLADSLERHFGSCATSSATLVQGWDCSTYDSRDSDNDGISDAEEVLGVQASDDDIPFRYWGSDPAHKDVFYEVDWDETEGGKMHDISTSLENNKLEKIIEYFARGSSIELANPNDLPGINFHFDLANKTYTNLNGHIGVAFDGGGSNYILNNERCRNSHELRRMTNMSQTRQQYFRFLCGHLGSGG